MQTELHSWFTEHEREGRRFCSAAQQAKLLQRDLCGFQHLSSQQRDGGLTGNTHTHTHRPGHPDLNHPGPTAASLYHEGSSWMSKLSPHISLLFHHSRKTSALNSDIKKQNSRKLMLSPQMKLCFGQVTMLPLQMDKIYDMKPGI